MYKQKKLSNNSGKEKARTNRLGVEEPLFIIYLNKVFKEIASLNRKMGRVEKMMDDFIDDRALDQMSAEAPF